MDLTPRLLTEVEFREEWRGYSRKDVDDFLERVAVAVGELQERLRIATERTAEAERRLLDRSVDDDELGRTLVLAQRTAATAIEEARIEAQRIRDEAQERLEAAEARLAEVDHEVTERSRIELGGLAERRAALQADVAALSAFAEEHRGRLRAELERQLAALDEQPAALVVPDPPETSDVEVDMTASVQVQEPELAGPELQRESLTEPAPAPLESPTEEGAGAGGRPVAGGEDEPELTWAPEPLHEHGEHGESTGESPSLYDAADESGEIDLSAGAPTGLFDALADEDEQGRSTPEDGDEDDPFLAELRRAVTDTEPLGPRDAELPTPAVEDDDARRSGRFRPRRGR